MSFVGNLSKEFIRSAVSQVGRDGGRIVSNQVYDNSFSVPVDSISNRSTSTSPLLEEKEYIYVKFIWAIFLSFVIPYLGSFIVIIKGFINYFNKYTSMYRIEQRAVYKTDNRYSNGRRFLGMQGVKISTDVKLTPEQQRFKRIKAIGYFVIGFGVIVFYTIVFSR